MGELEKHNNSNGLKKFSNFVIFQTADGKVNCKYPLVFLLHLKLDFLIQRMNNFVHELLKR